MYLCGCMCVFRIVQSVSFKSEKSKYDCLKYRQFSIS